MTRALRFSPQEATTLLEYDRAVFERFVHRVRRLPGKSATRRRGIGHESIFDTLVHILNVHEVWLVYIIRGRNSESELEKLFEDRSRHPTTWEEFDVYARKVWAGVDKSLAALTSRSLGRAAKVFWMPGRYTVRDAFLQTTFEEAHHLGEIIGALWQEEIEPPDMTWIDVGRGRAHRTTRSARSRSPRR